MKRTFAVLLVSTPKFRFFYCSDKDIVRSQEASFLSSPTYGSFLPWRVQLRWACCLCNRRRRRENSYDRDDDDDDGVARLTSEKLPTKRRRRDIKILMFACRTPEEIC